MFLFPLLEMNITLLRCGSKCLIVAKAVGSVYKPQVKRWGPFTQSTRSGLGLN